MASACRSVDEPLWRVGRVIAPLTVAGLCLGEFLSLQLGIISDGQFVRSTMDIAMTVVVYQLVEKLSTKTPIK